MNRLEYDLIRLQEHARIVSRGLYWFSCPMAGGMMRKSDLVTTALGDELRRTERRIRNIKQMLNRVS